MTDVIEAMARAVVAHSESLAPDVRACESAEEWTYRFWLGAVRAALSAAEAAGWVLVPKEPTEEMLEASWGVSCRPTIEVALESCPRKQHWLKTAARYRSMIQSSPKVGI